MSSCVPLPNWRSKSPYSACLVYSLLFTSLRSKRCSRCRYADVDSSNHCSESSNLSNKVCPSAAGPYTTSVTLQKLSHGWAPATVDSSRVRELAGLSSAISTFVVRPLKILTERSAALLETATNHNQVPLAHRRSFLKTVTVGVAKSGHHLNGQAHHSKKRHLSISISCTYRRDNTLDPIIVISYDSLPKRNGEKIYIDPPI